MTFATMARKRHSNDSRIDKDIPLELAVGIHGEAQTVMARRPKVCITRGESRDAKLALLKLFGNAISHRPAFQNQSKMLS